MTVWIQNPFDSLPQEGFRKQRYWLMAEAFAEAGHEVVYFTSDFSHSKKARREIGSSGNSAIRVVAIKTKPYRRNVSIARVISHRAYAAEWERIAEGKPEMIISSMPTISAAEAALRLGRRFGAKTIIDVQDAWPETFERLAPTCLRGLARIALGALRRRVRNVFAGADLVTGTCERYRELVGRVDYIRAYLGIEIDATLSGARVDSKSTRLVYVGNLGCSYDLKTVIEAVESNADFTLDVAGFGGGCAVSERVRFHGTLSDGELRELLAKCDVGVIPMADDSWVGMPNKLFDYSRAGLRVVSSLSGESAELIGRYGCGAIYRVGDARSLAGAVREAMKTAGGASRRMCESEFDARAIYREYVRRVSDAIA